MKSQALPIPAPQPVPCCLDTQGGTLSSGHVAMVAFPPVEPVRFTIFRIKLTPLRVTDRPASPWPQLATKPVSCHAPFLTHALLRLALHQNTLPLDSLLEGCLPLPTPSQVSPSPNFPESLHDCPFLPITCSHSTWCLVLPITSQILL